LPARTLCAISPVRLQKIVKITLSCSVTPIVAARAMFSRHINSPAALSQSGFTGDVLGVTISSLNRSR
jgi:hypothetical protein